MTRSKGKRLRIGLATGKGIVLGPVVVTWGEWSTARGVKVEMPIFIWRGWC